VDLPGVCLAPSCSAVFPRTAPPGSTNHPQIQQSKRFLYSRPCGNDVYEINEHRVTIIVSSLVEDRLLIYYTLQEGSPPPFSFGISGTPELLSVRVFGTDSCLRLGLPCTRRIIFCAAHRDESFIAYPIPLSTGLLSAES